MTTSTSHTRRTDLLHRNDHLRLIPPPEYDHPYTGQLTVVQARDQDHVGQLCPGVKFGPELGALACSYADRLSCTIVISPDAYLKAKGLHRGLVMNHELAHCNGWPGNHPGALPYHDWGLPDLDALEEAAKVLKR